MKLLMLEIQALANLGVFAGFFLVSFFFVWVIMVHDNAPDAIRHLQSDQC
jgi:hypothetical protein